MTRDAAKKLIATMSLKEKRAIYALLSNLPSSQSLVRYPPDLNLQAAPQGAHQVQIQG